MWIDTEGVYHTVAVPDPTALMSPAFRSSLDRLLATLADGVAEVVESEETRFYDDRAGARGVVTIELQFEDVPAPEVLTEPVSSLEDLRSLVRGVAFRWRLDALTALNDYAS